VWKNYSDSLSRWRKKLDAVYNRSDTIPALNRQNLTEFDTLLLNSRVRFENQTQNSLVITVSLRNWGWFYDLCYPRRFIMWPSSL